MNKQIKIRLIHNMDNFIGIIIRLSLQAIRVSLTASSSSRRKYNRLSSICKLQISNLWMLSVIFSAVKGLSTSKILERHRDEASRNLFADRLLASDWSLFVISVTYCFKIIVFLIVELPQNEIINRFSQS